jgi:hypothetical protein
MSVSTVRYNKINNQNKKTFSIPAIQSYVPIQSDTDYLKGYIIRYFIQKINDVNAPIIEISSDTYSQFIDNNFYNVVNLDWKLTGTYDEIKQANIKSLNIASKTIPSIHLYLPYLLQFSKNNLVVSN